MTTRSLTFTLDSCITSPHIQQVGIHDTSVILSRSHKYQPTSFIIEPGLLLIKLLLLLLTHSVTNYELGPYPRVRLSIDLIHTLQRLAHCTHTTEPMVSHSHTCGHGVPTKPMYFHDTPRPLRPTPLWAKSWVAPCLPKAPMATVVAKRGQGSILNNGHTRLMPSYLIRVEHAHNIPSLEAPARGMTIERIKAIPIKGKCGCTGQLDLVAP